MTWSMPPLPTWREGLSPSSLAGPLDRWPMRIQPSTHLRGRIWSVWWVCGNFFWNHLFAIGSQFPSLMRLPVNVTNPPVFTHQMSVCNPVKMSRLVTLPFPLKFLEIIISFEGWGCLGSIVPHPKPVRHFRRRALVHPELVPISSDFHCRTFFYRPDADEISVQQIVDRYSCP